jgi:hypothetical protein
VSLVARGIDLHVRVGEGVAVFHDIGRQHPETQRLSDAATLAVPLNGSSATPAGNPRARAACRRMNPNSFVLLPM